jgi:hypothetical protein
MAKEPKELKEQKMVEYRPTEEEVSWINHVYNRKKNMEQGRTSGSGTVDDWEKYWDDSDKAYDAEPPRTPDTDDWRSNLHIPVEWSIVETMKQEMMEQVTTFKVEPTEAGDIPKTPFMNETIDFALEKMNWINSKYLIDHEKLVRGTCITKQVYRREKRTVFDPQDTDNPDEEEYAENEILDFDDVYIKYVDLWMFFTDEMARAIEDARDCIEREIMDIKEFHRLYDDRYPDAKYVVTGGDTQQNQYYKPPSDVEKRDVEVLHYWNKPFDKYLIVVNGVLVRNNPNPYAHKDLPYALHYGYRTTDSIYGKSVPMQIKTLVDELNTLRNLRIDFQHMSIDKMFLVSDQLDVDEEDLTVRPHGAIYVNTTTMPIQNYIMPIEYGDIKPSSAQDIDMLFEDIRRTVGVDDRVQGVMPPGSKGTATEAAILKEQFLVLRK